MSKKPAAVPRNGRQQLNLLRWSLLAFLLMLCSQLGCNSGTRAPSGEFLVDSGSRSIRACFPLIGDEIPPGDRASVEALLRRNGFVSADSIDAVISTPGPFIALRPDGSYSVFASALATNSGTVVQAITNQLVAVVAPIERCVGASDVLYYRPEGAGAGADRGDLVLSVVPSVHARIVDPGVPPGAGEVRFRLAVHQGARLSSIVPSCSCMSYEVEQRDSVTEIVYRPNSYEADFDHGYFNVSVTRDGVPQQVELHSFVNKLAHARVVPSEIAFGDVGDMGGPLEAALKPIELRPGELKLHRVACSHPALSAFVRGKQLIVALDPAKVVRSREKYEESLVVPMASGEPLSVPVSFYRRNLVRLPSVVDLGSVESGMVTARVCCRKERPVDVVGVVASDGVAASIEGQDREQVTFVVSANFSHVGERTRDAMFSLVAEGQDVLAEGRVRLVASVHSSSAGESR